MSYSWGWGEHPCKGGIRTRRKELRYPDWSILGRQNIKHKGPGFGGSGQRAARKELVAAQCMREEDKTGSQCVSGPRGSWKTTLLTIPSKTRDVLVTVNQ